MRQELAEVKTYSDDATREQVAIANKWSDGAGTYTPPGHWNDIAAEYIRDANWSEVRAARAFALLNMSHARRAPSAAGRRSTSTSTRGRRTSIPSVKTAIGVPNFPAYTSGHSTFSGAAAAVLSYLFPSHTADFEAMKDEASISRLYGSIHYRSDIEVGKDHGKRIARLHGQVRAGRRSRIGRCSILARRIG